MFKLSNNITTFIATAALLTITIGFLSGCAGISTRTEIATLSIPADDSLNTNPVWQEFVNAMGSVKDLTEKEKVAFATLAQIDGNALLSKDVIRIQKRIRAIHRELTLANQLTDAANSVTDKGTFDAAVNYIDHYKWFNSEASMIHVPAKTYFELRRTYDSARTIIWSHVVAQTSQKLEESSSSQSRKEILEDLLHHYAVALSQTFLPAEGRVNAESTRRQLERAVAMIKKEPWVEKFARAGRAIDTATDFERLSTNMGYMVKLGTQAMKQDIWSNDERADIVENGAKWETARARLHNDLGSEIAFIKANVARDQVGFVNVKACRDFKNAKLFYENEKHKSWYRNEDERQFIKAMLLLDRVKADKRVDYSMRKEASHYWGKCRSELSRGDYKNYSRSPAMPTYKNLGDYPDPSKQEIDDAAKDEVMRKRNHKPQIKEPHYG